MGILVSPILSSSSLDFWEQAEVSVIDERGDTVVIEARTGTSTFTYTIDTTRWVIAGLMTSGDLYYNATYDWAAEGEIHYLTDVYVGGDTTFVSGGLDFSNIRLNDDVGVREVAGRRAFPGGPGAAGGFTRRPRTVVVRDLRGRRTGLHAVRPGATLPRLPALPAGAYVVEEVDESGRSAGVVRSLR